MCIFYPVDQYLLCLVTTNLPHYFGKAKVWHCSIGAWHSLVRWTWVFFLYVMLGSQPRVLYRIGKCSSSRVHHQSWQGELLPAVVSNMSSSSLMHTSSLLMQWFILIFNKCELRIQILDLEPIYKAKGDSSVPRQWVHWQGEGRSLHTKHQAHCILRARASWLN